MPRVPDLSPEDTETLCFGLIGIDTATAVRDSAVAKHLEDIAHIGCTSTQYARATGRSQTTSKDRVRRAKLDLPRRRGH